MTIRPATLPAVRLAALALLAAACGGTASGPAAPATPPAGPHGVAGVVFYDQNGNGVLDASERVRLPGVRVSAGSQSAQTDATGAFTVSGLSAGSLTLAVQADSLPPYYQPGPAQAVTLPASSPLSVPVTLPIGGNRPNRYLAFGDSLTAGVGSEGRAGYTLGLEARLHAHLGEAEMLRDGVPGSQTPDGLERLPGMLADDQPAFLLLLYGTNDWNRCQSRAPADCFTVASLRDMIRVARRAGSLPVVGTIVPANPAFPERNAAQRNVWIQAQNELIRTMVQQEGAVLAECHQAFGSDPAAWPALFFDHLHPADDGYARITDAFFQAITRSRGSR